MNEQTVWRPVEGQTRIQCDCGECDRTIEVDDGYIQIYDRDGEELTAHLPGGYALCRRVPAAGGSIDVPVDALNRLTAWVADWCNGNDDGFDDLAADVIECRAWLRTLAKQGVPVEMLRVLIAAVNDSIDDIAASYQQAYWDEYGEPKGEAMVQAMRDDADLNALIDAKRWLEAQVSTSETEPEI